MKILKITLLIRRNETDKVFLHTDLPPATFPFKETPSIEFDVASMHGEEYIANNFPNIPVEKVDM